MIGIIDIIRNSNKSHSCKIFNLIDIKAVNLPSATNKKNNKGVSQLINSQNN
jgi:hypothetical protein